MAILDEVVKVVKPSNQRYIYRYHATPYNNVSKIIKEGILAQRPTWATNDYPKTAWTSVNNGFFPLKGDSYIELAFPKEDYVNLERYTEYNPEWQSTTSLPNMRDYKGKIRIFSPKTNQGRNHWPVEKGGRLDAFKNTIDPKYIKKICMPGQGCFTPEEWLERFGE